MGVNVGDQAKARSVAMLHILLNRYFHQVADIGQHLPESDRAALQNSKQSTADPITLIRQPTHYLEKVHYSWLTAPIASLPKPLQDPTIAALTLPQRQGLCRLLKRSLPTVHPAPDFCDFLLDTVVKELKVREQAPISNLPDSPFNSLATYSKSQLQRLIDLLGVRDLAQEMRLIVNKMHQKKLLECLSDEERRFFDFYLYKEPEKLVIQRLDLKEWGGDLVKLRQQLHLRGLGRLGRALSGQGTDLIWHLTHTLDTGRAAVITRTMEVTTTENVRSELQRQVIGLINYINKHE